MIFNMISGRKKGADLNFSVVAYAPEDDIPQTADKNIIAVVTDTEITSWSFREDEPEAPVTGDVWFKIGTTSVSEFNALTENELIVYPQICKQYIDGEWVVKTTKSYVNGQLTSWFDGILFDNGNQYKDITGGWVNVDDGSLITASQGTSTNNTGAITDLRHTVNMIDLTNWTTVKANLTARTGRTNLIVTKDTTPLFANFAAWQQIDSDYEITLDVSDLDGEYYVAMAAGTNAASFTADKVWLE